MADSDPVDCGTYGLTVQGTNARRRETDGSRVTSSRRFRHGRCAADIRHGPLRQTSQLFRCQAAVVIQWAQAVVSS